MYFGNAVFAGLSVDNISKLQSVLNAASCLSGGVSRYDHVAFFMRDTLHLLSIQQYIQFKIMTLMCNCLVALFHPTTKLTRHAVWDISVLSVWREGLVHSSDCDQLLPDRAEPPVRPPGFNSSRRLRSTVIDFARVIMVMVAVHRVSSDGDKRWSSAQLGRNANHGTRWPCRSQKTPLHGRLMTVYFADDSACDWLGTSPMH